MSPAETADRLDVVAVAPHPDDLEITCGGTLALLVKQGYRVGMLDLTTGEPTPRGTVEIRAREAEAARQVLGVPFRRCVGLPNRVLMDSPENRFVLATWFRRLMPTIVICPAGRTPAASPDHYQGQLLVEARGSTRAHQVGRPLRRRPAVPRAAPGLRPVPVRRRGPPVPRWVRRRCHVHVRAEDGGDPLLRVAVRRMRFAKVRHFVSGNNVSVGGRCGFAYGEAYPLPTTIGTSDLHSLVMGGKATAAPVSLPGQPAPPLE